MCTNTYRGREGEEGGVRERVPLCELRLLLACKQLNFTLPIDSFSATAKNMLNESTPQ